MQVKQKIYLLIGLLSLTNSLTNSLKAQILDDTTKQVYNAKTTEYVLEQDILENTGKRYNIDTTLNNLHNYNIVQGNQNMFVDLGSFGTASRTLFYHTPTQIGTQIGAIPYQPYTFNAQNVRYYDTKSPFTQAFYVQGSTGDQMIHFVFTRSINKNWNFGIHYTRLNSYKPFGGSNSKETLADQIRFTAHTRFQSGNGKYYLLYHYFHLNNKSAESGGVLVRERFEPDTVYDARLATAILGNRAESWHTQNNHRLYHHYALAKEFTLFHIADIRRQRDDYHDTDPLTNPDFYLGTRLYRRAEQQPYLYFDNERTGESSLYNLYENKFGIKGKITKFNYIAHFKNRVYRWNTSLEGQISLTSDATDTVLVRLPQNKVVGRVAEFENFIGGKLFYQFSDSIRLTAEAEYLIGKDYVLHGILDSKNIRAGFKSMLYSPSILQRQFYSNHFIWKDNNLKSTLANELYGSIVLNTKRLRFNPFASYILLTNYIYFDTLAAPKQDLGVIQLLKIGANFEAKLGRVKTLTSVFYTVKSGADVMRFPAFVANARVYCEDCFFKSLLQSQIGVELHYKTDYQGDAYMPVSRQFHLQDGFVVKNYLIADIFFNFRIKNLRAFLKLMHANQLPDTGYIMTPIYPGMRRNFVFGINWQFFD